MHPDPTWRYHARSADGRTIVELAGEIGMSAAAQLQKLLNQAVVASHRVTVDLAGVEFIDSTVISAFVRANNTAAATGRQLTVINAGAQVHRVLQMTGILGTVAGNNT